MAARTRKIVLSDEWKEKIQASQLMNRLMKHFDGEIELTKTQIDVAKILLSKIVPDLARTELTGKGGEPLQIQIVRFSDRPATCE